MANKPKIIWVHEVIDKLVDETFTGELLISFNLGGVSEAVKKERLIFQGKKDN